MRPARKDAAATALTLLIALVFVVTHEGWSVPLIGDSHRWAAAVILLLGAIACGLGDAERPADHKLATGLGIGAAGLGVAALITGSLTLLSVLVVDIVVLWAVATVDHAGHPHRAVHAAGR